MAGYNIPPLKQRIFRSKMKNASPPIDTKIPFRPKAYSQWKETRMEGAITAVDKGESIRRAAEKFGVPRSTLHDHVSGKVEQHAKQGPKPYLTPEDEDELANFLLRCSRIGYPHTRQQVLSIVQDILNSKGINVVVSNGWWERFLQRHPHLTLRTAYPLSYLRAMSSDRDSIERYYDLLEDTLRSNEIFDDPTRIFNCDETGVPLNPKPLKVVGEVGTKNPCNFTGNQKSQITVLACTSAAGYPLPPFVIFDRKTLTKELTKGEVPGAAYGLSSKGWMDGELFRDWFIGHFLSYAPACRPLLLLLDGHSSHYCPEVIRTAASNGVVVFALPPHTTHLSQPLDKGAFAPLKMEWRKVAQSFISRHPGRDITRYEFSSLFAKAWSNAMTLGNIAAGFRVTGVYPFNRNAIRLPSEEPSKFDPEALAKSTGIKYIPLYSPAHSRQPKATTVSIHDKYSGRTSSQLISPVKHHEFDPLDYSLTSYGAYTSTPVGLRSPPFDDSHVSFLHDSLSLTIYWSVLALTPLYISTPQNSSL